MAHANSYLLSEHPLLNKKKKLSQMTNISLEIRSFTFTVLLCPLSNRSGMFLVSVGQGWRLSTYSSSKNPKVSRTKHKFICNKKYQQDTRAEPHQNVFLSKVM